MCAQPLEPKDPTSDDFVPLASVTIEATERASLRTWLAAGSYGRSAGDQRLLIKRTLLPYHRRQRRHPASKEKLCH
jgi:hypothetical protein